MMHLKTGFNETTNRAFLQSKEFVDLPYLRKAFTAFIILFALFGFIDPVYFPSNWGVLFIIRFAVVIPLFVVTVFLTFHKRFLMFYQHVLALCFAVGGIAIAIMLIMLPENIVYYGGLYLVYFSGYLLLRLRYIYASIAGWTVFSFHIIGSLLATGPLPNIVLYGAVFFVGANLIGMFGAYHFEQKNRTQFLRDIIIKEINNEMLAQFDEKTKQYDQLMTSIRKNQELIFKNEEKDRLTESLRQSEEQYKLLTTQMPLGLALHEVILNEDGKPIDYRYLSVNNSFERMTGLQRKDIIGKTVLEILPKTEHVWIDGFGTVAITGKPATFHDYAASLGRYYQVFAYSPKRGQFAVIVDDVTERMRFENQLKQREKDLLATQKIAHLGSWRLNVETNEVVWTEELYKMYGFDPKKPVPPYTEHMKLFTPASWDQLRTALALTVQFGIAYDLELETVTSEGKNGWMWVHGEAEKDPYGKTLSIWGSAQDITEFKKMQRALNETNERYRAIFEQSPVAIEFYNADGVLQNANEACLNLFGVTSLAEISGFTLFKNPNLTPEILAQIKRREPVNMEFVFNFDAAVSKGFYDTKRMGIRLLNVSIIPLLHEGDFHGYVVQTIDKTEDQRKE
jgi:PAS domain S-box-containing protein